MSLSSPSLNTQSFNVASPLIVTRDNIGHVMPPILIKIGKTQKEWQALVRENYSTCRHFDSVSMRKKEATLLNLSTFFKGHPLPVGNYLDIINISAEQMGLPFPNNPEKGGRSLPKLAILCGLVLAGIGIASLKSQPNNDAILKEKLKGFGPLINCITWPEEDFDPGVELIPGGVKFNGKHLTGSSGNYHVNGESLTSEQRICVAEEEKKQAEITDSFTTNLLQKKWSEALADAVKIEYYHRHSLLQTLVNDCDDLCDDLDIREKAIAEMNITERNHAYPKLVHDYLLQKKYHRALATALKISSVEKIESLQSIVDQCTDLTIRQEAIRYRDAFRDDLPLKNLVYTHLSNKEYEKALTTALTMTSGFKNQCLGDIIFKCHDLKIKEKAADAMITTSDKNESISSVTKLTDLVYKKVADEAFSGEDYKKALDTALKMTPAFKSVSLKKIIDKCVNTDIKKRAEEERNLLNKLFGL